MYPGRKLRGALRAYIVGSKPGLPRLRRSLVDLTKVLRSDGMGYVWYEDACFHVMYEYSPM